MPPWPQPHRGQQSDRELVDRVAKGDRAAVRLLFMRHHARVYRFVARQTGSEIDG